MASRSIHGDGPRGREPSRLPRREALAVVGRALGVLATGSLAPLSGCSPPPGGEGTLRLDLAQLPPGSRKVVRFRDRPVELTREGDAVTARSLVCTHFSCIVQWKEAERIYLCPCHRGRFDAAGRVLDGPPILPLEEFPARISGSEVLVGGV